MKDNVLCRCNSGIPRSICCELLPEIKTFINSTTSPFIQQEHIDNIQIATNFNLPIRGYLHFYGKELIDYVKEVKASDNTYIFLEALSHYLYTKHEEDQIHSWNECQTNFWDEFISTYCPHNLYLSTQENEVDEFLYQLTNFAIWFEFQQNQNVSLLHLILPCITAYKSDLLLCEKLINFLYQKHWPNILHKDWNYLQALDEEENTLNSYSFIEEGLFEITELKDEIVVIQLLDTKEYFSIAGLPTNLVKPELLIYGTIGQHFRGSSWDWIFTSGVYPQQSKLYLPLHMETAKTTLYISTSFRV